MEPFFDLLLSVGPFSLALYRPLTDVFSLYTFSYYHGCFLFGSIWLEIEVIYHIISIYLRFFLFFFQIVSKAFKDTGFGLCSGILTLDQVQSKPSLS